MRRMHPLVSAGLAALVLASSGCKRHGPLDAPDVFDDAPSTAQAEALETLTPPWPPAPPRRADNGAVWVWMEEPDSPAFNLRLLLPTPTSEASLGAYAVAAEALRIRTARRGRRHGAHIELVHQPNRLELVIRSRDAEAEALLAMLAGALRHPGQRELAAARKRLVQRLEQPWSEAIATSALIADLLQRPRLEVRLDRDEIVGLRPNELTKAWDQLLDPRNAVVVVHAGRPARAHAASLERLSEVWKAGGLLGRKRAVLERLHPEPTRERETGQLRGDRPPAIMDAPTHARGGPVLVFGRTIATDTPERRSTARLAQRLVQEELDARLVITGDTGVFLVVVPLKGDPVERVRAALDRLHALSERRHETQRIFQAVQMWLGARVVARSLEDEDWTALWSQASDLADDDAAIADALQRDARAMLRIDPENLQRWQRRWLDPSLPGWSWAVAGLDDKDRKALRKLAPLTRAR